jgi:hypothetical protein
MSTPERIRKQVYLLTIEDLNEHPIWEFCSDEEGEEGQDEATVKPSEETEVQGYSPGAYILTADIIFADGSDGIGYIYSGEPDDFGCLQPNIVGASGQANLWLGWLKFVSNPQAAISKACEALGKEPSAIFPIRFITRPHINGSPMELVAASFMAKGADQKVTDRSLVAVKTAS